MMKRTRVLITAGATMTMIDKVRGVTNVFKGRTGTDIARYFQKEGCEVTLVTSSPWLLDSSRELITILSLASLCFLVGLFFSAYFLFFGSILVLFASYLNAYRMIINPIKIVGFQTYDDLYCSMKDMIAVDSEAEKFDIIIHSAAVSDYKITAVYVKKDNGTLERIEHTGKISSNHMRLYLEQEQTEKIVDRIKSDWHFQGKLVKFKLQVGISDEELLGIATKSMIHSNSDFMVANCLEWAREKAVIIDACGGAHKWVKRDQLSEYLYRRLIK